MLAGARQPLSAAGGGEAPSPGAPPRARRDRAERTAVLAAFLLIATAYLALIPRTWFLRPDSAVYMGLARSLARGEGYTFNLAPYGKYPPVFPGLLALVHATLGPNTWAMQAVVALCGVGSLGVAYVLVQKRAGRGPALAVVLLSATCTWFCAYSALYLLSGIPCAFLSLAALWAAERELGSARFSVLRWLGVAVLATLALYTHLRGVALVPALALGILVGRAPSRTRRERWLAAGVVAVLGCLAAGYWVVRGWGLPDTSSYQGLVSAPARDVGRVAEMAALRLREWTATPLSTNYRRVSLPFGVVWLGLFLVPGLVKAIRQSRDLAALYVCAYFAVMALTGGSGGHERYVVPVVPLLFYFGYASATALARWAASALGKLRRGARAPASSRLWPQVFALLVGLSVGVYGASRWAKGRSLSHGFTAEGRAEARRELGTWQQLGQWAELHVPRDATLCVSNLATWSYVCFFTERRTVAVEQEETTAGLLHMLARRDVGFVVVDAQPETEDRLLPALRQHADCFTLLRDSEHYRVYRVEKERVRALVAASRPPGGVSRRRWTRRPA